MAKILLAEDDQSMLGFIKLALEKAGHDVTAEGNGADALQHIEGGEDFDLLLSDIVMPGIDGIELSQKASALKPDLKVMFITGFSAVAVGHDDFDESQAKILAKPFHLNDLVEQVETLLAA
ncbi:MAG: response regulator [Alphaproteobacteria bacterium]